MIQYPGIVQTAAATIPKQSMITERGDDGLDQEQGLQWEESLEIQEDPGSVSSPLSLRATLEPEAHVTLDATINSMAASTLVDSGATGIFMHPRFAEECNATLQLKRAPREVRVIDGRMINSGLITHEAVVELVIGSHREKLVADITNTGRYPCILGIPWLIRHDPTICWSQRSVTFNSAYCGENCTMPDMMSLHSGIGNDAWRRSTDGGITASTLELASEFQKKEK